MRTTAKRMAILFACLLGVGSPGLSFGAPALPIFTAGSATVHVGDTFDIPISISSPSEVDSWQFDLSFAPGIIQANAVTEGPFLSSSGTKLTLFTPGVIDNTTGLISLVADAFVDVGPGPSGTGVIADIQFTALAPGISPLTLSNVFLNALDSGFQTVNGRVTVVPEPGSLTLVVLGLGAVALRRWRWSRVR